MRCFNCIVLYVSCIVLGVVVVALVVIMKSFFVKNEIMCVTNVFNPVVN